MDSELDAHAVTCTISLRFNLKRYQTGNGWSGVTSKSHIKISQTKHMDGSIKNYLLIDIKTALLEFFLGNHHDFKVYITFY